MYHVNSETLFIIAVCFTQERKLKNNLHAEAYSQFKTPVAIQIIHFLPPSEKGNFESHFSLNIPGAKYQMLFLKADAECS